VSRGGVLEMMGSSKQSDETELDCEIWEDERKLIRMRKYFVIGRGRESGTNESR